MPNVLIERDLVSRPDNMDELVTGTTHNTSLGTLRIMHGSRQFPQGGSVPVHCFSIISFHTRMGPASNQGVQQISTIHFLSTRFKIFPFKITLKCLCNIK